MSNYVVAMCHSDAFNNARYGEYHHYEEAKAMAEEYTDGDSCEPRCEYKVWVVDLVVTEMNDD